MLTKSDYLKYRQCIKSLWLYKNRKDLIPDEVGISLQKAFDEGFQVEDYAYQLFPQGASARSEEIRDMIVKTGRLIRQGAKTIFQPTFQTGKLFCRCDIIRLNKKTGKWDIYEVKSSVQPRDLHKIDLAFQKICLEETGLKVGRTILVHVNPGYVRNGVIDPEKFLKKADISDDVSALIKAVKLDIEEARKVLNFKAEPAVRILKQCRYPYECQFAEYCRSHVPKHSIYEINISESKLNWLLDREIIHLKDVPEDLLISRKHILHVKSVKTNRPVIDRPAIRGELAKLEYPIYFLDYETYGSAVPLFDGYRPYEQAVFQYSLHVIESPQGKLKHYAYLATEFEEPSKGAAAALSKLIGDKGSVVVWFMDFEGGRNSEMGRRHKKYHDFFRSVNRRLFDLMEIFKQGHFVHKDFKASASLKKVLPAIIKHLSYEGLDIREGTAASESWRRMIDLKTPVKEKAKIKKDLLAYCELDTLAMVEIWKFLIKLVGAQK